MVNEKGEAVYCKFHFKTDQKIKNLSAEKAGELSATDPDYAIGDLYNSIHQGNYPSWTAYIQIMTFDEANRCSFNPFDLTKVWPQRDYPLIQFGRLVLNRNPTNYFAEVEQIAFCPAHMVPGIEPSPDKMLQGRLFSYVDTHRHRLGTNYQQIPVNCPFNTRPANYQRDGPQCVTDNGKGAPNYYPNSFNGPKDDAKFKHHVEKVMGDVDRHESGNEDNFSQVGIFYEKVLSVDARDRLTSNIAGHLKDALPFIQERAISNFSKCHPEYGAAIKRKLDEIKREANKPRL